MLVGLDHSACSVGPGYINFDTGFLVGLVSFEFIILDD